MTMFSKIYRLPSAQLRASGSSVTPMSQGSQQSLLASSSMRCAKVALVVLMVGGLGACATSTPLQSNKATSYDGLVKSNDLAMAIPPKQDDFGRYKWATIEPIEVEDSVTAEVSTETTKEVRDVLQNILATEVSKSFSLSERSANKPALVLRVRITRITEASPALNALTTALIGPLRNGALATELEAIDADSGRQLALLLWADSGGMVKDFAGNFNRTAHARSLAARFASDANTFLAPLSRPVP